MAKRKLPPNEVIVSLYREGHSTPAIAEMYGVTQATVWGLLRRIGEPRRSSSEAQSLSFESGRHVSPRFWEGKKQPREMVEKRLDAIRGQAHYLWKGGVSDPREYRKVVEKTVCAKCGARDHLLIHHDNGDHYDNAPENLSVLCLSCHSSIHKKAYWDAIRAGEEPPKSNAPNNWRREAKS